MYDPIKDIVFYYVHEPVLHTSTLGYLQYVLRSAIKYSPECKVWLISNDNPNIEGINFVSIESLKNELAEEYKTNFAYPYVRNPEQYVFEGMNRWFYINELVKQKGLTSFVNFDTDVMVLTEVSETEQKYPIATHIGYDHFKTDKIRTDFICPHVFFCNDVKILDDYCQYCVYLFQDKTSEYYRLCDEMEVYKQSDGITDMATLGLYMTRHRHYFGYGTGIIGDSCYDVAIEGSDGLDMEGEFKKYEKVGDIFMGFVNGERKIKINSIHFNGPYKKYIQEFYEKYIR